MKKCSSTLVFYISSFKGHLFFYVFVLREGQLLVGTEILCEEKICYFCYLLFAFAICYLLCAFVICYLLFAIKKKFVILFLSLCKVKKIDWCWYDLEINLNGIGKCPHPRIYLSANYFYSVDLWLLFNNQLSHCSQIVKPFAGVSALTINYYV